MKLAKATKVPGKGSRRKGEIAAFLESFLDSDEALMEVAEWKTDYKTTWSCVNSFNKVAARENLKIRMRVRGDKIYIGRA